MGDALQEDKKTLDWQANTGEGALKFGMAAMKCGMATNSWV